MRRGRICRVTINAGCTRSGSLSTSWWFAFWEDPGTSSTGSPTGSPAWVRNVFCSTVNVFCLVGIIFVGMDFSKISVDLMKIFQVLTCIYMYIQILAFSDVLTYKYWHLAMYLIWIHSLREKNKNTSRQSNFNTLNTVSSYNILWLIEHGAHWFLTSIPVFGGSQL